MPPKSTLTTQPKAQQSKGGKKPPSKPPKPAEEQIKRHFNSLSAQIDDGHFKNAIKTCDRILRLAPGDEDALDSKLFLLVQTEQYEAALQLVQEYPNASETSHLFEKAYLLYRLHKETEALAIIQTAKANIGSDNRALLHLEAQVKYREAEYEAAREIYDALLNTCPEDTEEYSDLLTNLNATQAHLDFLNNGYLSALNSLTTSVSALEDAGAPTLPSTSAATVTASAAAKATPTSAAEEGSVVKPSRKSRIPKHVVLGVTPLPDPERWLKKRERTKVEGRGGRRGRRKEGMGVGATQGIALPVEKEQRGATPTPATSTATSSRPKKGKKGR